MANIIRVLYEIWKILKDLKRKGWTRKLEKIHSAFCSLPKGLTLGNKPILFKSRLIFAWFTVGDAQCCIPYWPSEISKFALQLKMAIQLYVYMWGEGYWIPCELLKILNFYWLAQLLASLFTQTKLIIPSRWQRCQSQCLFIRKMINLTHQIFTILLRLFSKSYDRHLYWKLDIGWYKKIYWQTSKLDPVRLINAQFVHSVTSSNGTYSCYFCGLWSLYWCNP